MHSETLYKSMFEKSGEGMLLMSGDKFALANEAAAQMLGYDSCEELANTHPWQISPKLQPNGRSSESRGHEMLGIVNQAGRHRFEWDHLSKDGSVIPVDVTLTCITDGVDEFILSTWRDISEQREIQTALNDAILQAEAVVRLKTEFLSNMSHEIRTPLNGLLGLLDVVSGRPIERDTLKLIRIAMLSGESLLGIVNDFLDLSSLQSGRVEPKLRRVKISALVSDVMKGMRSLAEAKKVDLIFQPHASTQLPILIDDRHFRQVLFNLVGNAIKFTNEGHVTVNVEFIQASLASGEVYLRVQDTGIGIAEEFQQLIFKRFHQVDGSLSRDFQGTGLGLAICKELVELHKGSINVESSANIGSTFNVRWPVACADVSSGSDTSGR